MKFFSKFANFRIVLKHSMPGEPLTGRAAVPGVYVKFENGEVDVVSQEIIDMLLAHPRFGRDFVAQDADPFKNRKAAEPEHDLINIEYGHVGKNLNPKPGKEALVKDQALALAKEIAIPLAKEMAKEMLKEMMAETQAAAKPAAAKEPVAVKEEAKAAKK